MTVPEAYEIYKERFSNKEPVSITEVGDYYIMNDNSKALAPSPSVNKSTGEIAFLNPLQMGLTREDIQNKRVYEGEELRNLLGDEIRL